MRLFEHDLPQMAAAIAGGQAELSDGIGLYHLVLEAIVLSLGQAALLDELRGFPGIAGGVARVQADERWHVGLGVHLLQDRHRTWNDPDGALAIRAVLAWGPGVATRDESAMRWPRTADDWRCCLVTYLIRIQQSRRKGAGQLVPAKESNR